MAVVIYADAHKSMATQDMVSHTQDVLLNLGSAQRELDSVELNAELYRALHDNDRWLNTETSAVNLQTLVARLAVLVHVTPEQKVRAHALGTATAALMQDVKQRAPAPRLHNDVTACRMSLSLMRDQEQILLAQRIDAENQERFYSILRRGAVIGAGTILVLVLFYFLIRDALRRARFEERLEEANARLRSTVERLEEQAFEAQLLIDARDEVALCQDVEQAEACTVRYFAQLIPGTAGSLCIINNSRHLMESVGSWGAVRGTAVFDGFAPECCCALRSGRARWRRPEQSEVHCTHFSGTPPERYLCLPVVAHGETLGVVTVECLSPEAARMAEAREESVISLAEMAAMAISGLRLRTRLERQSIRDGMTGLFNRSFMEVALDRELHRAARQNKELALMMVDIDHFKQFNDTFGHEAGDVVLREVAENLRLGVRSEDIVCRFGGEEFVIILPEISPASALERGELLRQKIESLAVRYHGQPLRQVTVSVGLALSTRASDASDDLLRTADRAMYAAKRQGRNRVIQAESGVEA